MEYINLLWSNIKGVANIRLNRPTVLNSFNREMASELHHALDEAANNEGVRAIVIGGEGRAFCAGQDLAEVMPAEKPEDTELGATVNYTYNPIIRRIRNVEKPVICAVNGVAAGAGANIALACDFVVAAKNASFIQSFSNIGLVPDSGGTFFLPRMLGFQKATSWMMLGEKIRAEEAFKLGLIYKMVENEDLEKECMTLAERLAAMPTRGLGLIKRALNRSMINDLEQQLKLEAELQQIAGKTNDYTEGIRAFLEKRKPVFKGN